jgi:hypothetical protein
MGSKPSNNFQMDRPESGGADRDAERETSGLLDRAKAEFAGGEKRKVAGRGTRRHGDLTGAPEKAGERPPVAARGKGRRNR